MNKDIEVSGMQYAMEIHQNIMVNGGIAANALCEMCRNLKIMRDEKLYEALGYSDFDTYSLQMAKIKARQAHTYITTYERLGESVLQSTANKMGITKLELIAQMPPADQFDALEKSDEIAGMTVAQVRELVAKSKQQGEQLSLLETESKEKDGTIEYLNEKLKDTEKELTGQTLEAKVLPDDHETEKIIKAAKAEAEAEYKAALDKLEKKHQKDIEKAVSEAEVKGQEESDDPGEDDETDEDTLKAEYEQKISELEAAASEARLRAETLEKQLKLSGSEFTTVKIYLQDIQDTFKKCVSYLQDKKTDSETYLKCASAVLKMAEMLQIEAGGLVK